jgi:malonyl-CoA/methylmalonyl-CoA synthetase
VTNGSAGLPRPVGDRFEALCGLRPLERFGMTECGVATTQQLLPDARLRVPGSSGFPVTGMEVAVVDDQIFVRGPGVFPGYDRGVGSADDQSGGPAADGWFATGDAGELGPAGLVVRGRMSVDVLKSGGYKISALEIEAAIREHEEVEEVAVVGLPDEEWGDRVVAAIVPREGPRQGRLLDPEVLRAFLRDRLAPYKIPKSFVLRASLPRNTIGKVVKPALIAELAGHA